MLFCLTVCSPLRIMNGNMKQSLLITSTQYNVYVYKYFSNNTELSHIFGIRDEG